MTEDRTHDPPNRRQRLRPFGHSDLHTWEVYKPVSVPAPRGKSPYGYKGVGKIGAGYRALLPRPLGGDPLKKS